MATVHPRNVITSTSRETDHQLLAGLRELGVDLPDEALESISGGLADSALAGTDVLRAMRANLVNGFEQVSDIITFLQTEFFEGMERLAGGELDDRLAPKLPI